MNVVIAGGGNFGARAATKLREIAGKVTVVDVDPNCPASRINDINFIVGDASEYITKLMVNREIPDFIVPCVPGNLTARIFINFLSGLGFKVVMDEEGFARALPKIRKDIIVVADRSSATIVISRAKDYMCLPNCRQLEVCPVTKKATYPLYPILDVGGLGKIFISRPLSDGVGGISGKELYEELILKSKMKPSFSLYIGTACKCHGIVSFMRVR